MSYTIKIKKLTREQIKERNYVRVGQDEDGEPTYDYKTEEKTEDVEREVYTQIVDDLDLVRVINAINEVEDEK